METAKWAAYIALVLYYVLYSLGLVVQSAGLYARRLRRRPLLGTEVILLGFILGGVVGSEYGLRDLFWHDDPPTQFGAGVAVAVLVLLIWSLDIPVKASGDSFTARTAARPASALFVTPAAGPVYRSIAGAGVGALDVEVDTGSSRAAAMRDADWRLRSDLAQFVMPIGVALLAQPLWALRPVAASSKTMYVRDCLALPIGASLTFGTAAALLYLFGRWDRVARWRPWYGSAIGAALIGISHLLYGMRLLRGVLTAAASICLLLAEVALLAYAVGCFCRAARARYGPNAALLLKAVLALGVLGLIGWANGRDPYKLTLPGLEFYKSHGLLLPFEKRLSLSGRLSRLSPSTWQERMDWLESQDPNRTPVEIDADIRKSPEEPALYYTRGLAFQRDVKSQDQALADFSKVIQLAPMHAKAFSARSGIWHWKKEYQRALEDADESIRLAPQDPLSYDARAMANLWLHREKEADADRAHSRALFEAYKRAEIGKLLAERSKGWTPRSPFPYIDEREGQDWLRRLGYGLIDPPSTSSAGDLLDDCGVLQRWRQSGGCGTTGGRPPKLVVVAASGGGIVAAYWTAMCLAAIEDQYPHFPYHVRLVVGASGGMVGAARYVATLPPSGGPARTAEHRRALLDELAARDYLTPVVRRLVMGDFPSIFDPRVQKDDRGRELDRTFCRNTGGVLGRPLRDLAPGEWAGWRPSLVITPTILEDGVPLLISNLDLPDLAGGVGLFEMFPEAYDCLSLATALRLNAAFPYVTPAISLPTYPPRRVIDAGYRDNSGMSLAVEWLDRHYDWLQSNTSGVIVVQIRAYPVFAADVSRGALSAVGSGVQFLTAPLQGYSAAKLSTTLGRIGDRLGALKTRFNTDPNAVPFFRTFELECAEPAPLSWRLAARDRERLREALGAKEELIGIIARMTQNETSPPATTGGGYQSSGDTIPTPKN